MGGRSAFMPRHRRKRHSFPVALDDLVAWAWPVDPAEVEGNNTLFGEVRLSRCRARLVPQHRAGVPAGEAWQLQRRWAQGLTGVSIPLSVLQTALEHLFYTRSWDGIAHGTRGCGLALDKNSKELRNTAPPIV